MAMATPSEVPMMKRCHDCEVTKPVTDFLTYVSGTKAGRTVSTCIRCSMRSEHPPTVCAACGELRAVSDYDPQAENGTVCRACLVANPSAYRKLCTRCGSDRPFTQYSRVSRTAYRLPVCQGCDTKSTIAKNKRRPHVVSRRRKLHNQKIRMEVYLAYGGAFCACCGEKEISFLTLDHIHNDGAEWRRSIFRTNKGRGGISTYEWCKRNGYPPIFQVLCWNCQQGKRFSGGICPHQRETCNDYPHAGVEPSGSKRFGSAA